MTVAYFRFNEKDNGHSSVIFFASDKGSYSPPRVHAPIARNQLHAAVVEWSPSKTRIKLAAKLYPATYGKGQLY